jgi:hypothetical protein
MADKKNRNKYTNIVYWELVETSNIVHFSIFHFLFSFIPLFRLSDHQLVELCVQRGVGLNTLLVRLSTEQGLGPGGRVAELLDDRCLNKQHILFSEKNYSNYLRRLQLASVGQQQTIHDGHLQEQTPQASVAIGTHPLGVEEVGQLPQGLDVLALR